MRPHKQKSEFIRANANTMTIDQMAVELGVSKHSVKLMAAYHKIEVTATSKTAPSKFFKVHEKSNWLL